MPRPAFRLLAVLFLAVWLPSAAADVPGLPPAGAVEPDLVIVHTNDLHAHYRSFAGRDGEIRGGFARIAWRIAALGDRYGDRLLYLDAGDLFQGTPFYHFYRGSLGFELFERMGCDAMAMGNHELDDGSLNLMRASIGSSFPVLCANVERADGSALLPADVLLQAGDLRIAVIGLITETLPELTAECARGELRVKPPAAVLADWLPRQAGISDLAVALSHCGLDEDEALARAVPAIPLIIGGHSHSFLDKAVVVGTSTLCSTGAHGYNLGVVECFRRDDGGWRFESRLEPVTGDWPEDPEVAALIEQAGRLVDREMSMVLTQLPEPLGAENKSRQPDPLGIAIAELMRAAAGADLGLQNVGGYRTFLPAGDLTRGRLFELLPFDNKVLRLGFSGRELQALFDFLAAAHGSGRFGQIAGGSYEIAGGKAEEIRIAGEELDPDRRYTLATLDFLYEGGDGYAMLAAAAPVDTLDHFARELLEQRLRNGPPPRPSDYPPNFTVRDPK